MSESRDETKTVEPSAPPLPIDIDLNQAIRPILNDLRDLKKGTLPRAVAAFTLFQVTALDTFATDTLSNQQLIKLFTETNKEGDTVLMSCLKSKQPSNALNKITNTLFDLLQHVDKTSRAGVLKQKNKAGHDIFHYGMKNIQHVDNIKKLIDEQTKQAGSMTTSCENPVVPLFEARFQKQINRLNRQEYGRRRRSHQRLVSIFSAYKTETDPKIKHALENEWVQLLDKMPETYDVMKDLLQRSPLHPSPREAVVDLDEPSQVENADLRAWAEKARVVREMEMDMKLQTLKNAFQKTERMDRFALIKSLKLGLFDAPDSLSKAQLSSLLNQPGIFTGLLSTSTSQEACLATLGLLDELNPIEQATKIEASAPSLLPQIFGKESKACVFDRFLEQLNALIRQRVIQKPCQHYQNALNAVVAMPASKEKNRRWSALFESIPDEHLLGSLPNALFVDLCRDESFDVIANVLDKIKKLNAPASDIFHTIGLLAKAVTQKDVTQAEPEGFLVWGMRLLHQASPKTKSLVDLQKVLEELFLLIQETEHLDATDEKKQMQGLLHQRLMRDDGYDDVLSEALLSPHLLPFCLAAIRTLDLEDQAHLFEACRSTVNREKALQDCCVNNALRDYYLIELAHEVTSRHEKKDPLSVDLLALYNQLTRSIDDLKNPGNTARGDIHRARIQALWTAQERCKTSKTIQILLKRLEQSMYVDDYSNALALEVKAAADTEKQEENAAKWRALAEAVGALNPDFWNGWFETSKGLSLDKQASTLMGMRSADNQSSLLTATYLQFHASRPSIVTKLWDVMKTWSADNRKKVMDQCEAELSKDNFDDLKRILAEEKYVTDEHLIDFFELSNDLPSWTATTGTAPSPRVLEPQTPQQLTLGEHNPLVLAAIEDPDRIPDELQKIALMCQEDQLRCLDDFANQYPNIVKKNPAFRESPYFRVLVDHFATLKNANALADFRKVCSPGGALFHLPESVVSIQDQISYLRQSCNVAGYQQQQFAALIALIRTYPSKDIFLILSRSSSEFSSFLSEPSSRSVLLSTLKGLNGVDKIFLHTRIFSSFFTRYSLRREQGGDFDWNSILTSIFDEIRALPDASRGPVLRHAHEMMLKRGLDEVLVLSEIKRLNYEQQSIFLKEVGFNAAYKKPTAPITRRDYHLIELAAKVYEYRQRANWTQNTTEKKRYQAAENCALQLHQTLLGLSSDENNTVHNIKKTQQEWLQAVARAKIAFEKIDKGDLNIKGLLNRLWYGMKRITGFVLTPHALLGNLSAVAMLSSPQAKAKNAAEPSVVVANLTATANVNTPSPWFRTTDPFGFMPLEVAMKSASSEALYDLMLFVHKDLSEKERDKVLEHYDDQMKNVGFLSKPHWVREAKPVVKMHLYVLELERIGRSMCDSKYKDFHKKLLHHLLAYDQIKKPTQYDLLALQRQWGRIIEQSNIGTQQSWSSYFFGASGKGSSKDLYKKTLGMIKDEYVKDPQLKPKPSSR